LTKEKIAPGLTLVELILAAALSLIAVATVICGYNFLFTQTKSGLGRGDLNLQINYALEKIHLQCQSATSVVETSKFTAGVPQSELCIIGERDPYLVDIQDLSDNTEYCYYVEGKKLMLSADFNDSIEVLIGEKFKPRITFEYAVESGPNYLTVAITATAKNIRGQNTEVVKKEGIRFWYTTVTQ